MDEEHARERKYGDTGIAHPNQWMQHEEAQRDPTG